MAEPQGKGSLPVRTSSYVFKRCVGAQELVFRRGIRQELCISATSFDRKERTQSNFCDTGSFAHKSLLMSILLGFGCPDKVLVQGIGKVYVKQVGSSKLLMNYG